MHRLRHLYPIFHLIILLATCIAGTACSAKAPLDNETAPPPTVSIATATAIVSQPTTTPSSTIIPDTPTPTSTHSPTPHPTSTPTTTPKPTATLEPSPTPEPSSTPTIVASPTLPPNILGDVLVLEYHLIGEPEGRWQRTPTNFRDDIQRLFDLGYTPANIIDLSLGFPYLPAGRKPIILTFDDSDISHFRYLEDGSIDPDSAAGILYAFHQKHPQTWPLKATFYVLQDVDVPERILFGQRDAEDQKLQWLVEQGFEVGSHTISHFDLAAGTDEQVQWQLAISQRQLETRLPGYKLRSLSVPFGNYPANESLLAHGIWEDAPYTYANTVMVAGGATISPHNLEFDPYHIPRVQAVQTEIDYWLNYYEQNPQFYYVSAKP